MSRSPRLAKPQRAGSALLDGPRNAQRHATPLAVRARRSHGLPRRGCAAQYRSTVQPMQAAMQAGRSPSIAGTRQPRARPRPPLRGVHTNKHTPLFSTRTLDPAAVGTEPSASLRSLPHADDAWRLARLIERGQAGRDGPLLFFRPTRVHSTHRRGRTRLQILPAAPSESRRVQWAVAAVAAVATLVGSKLVREDGRGGRQGNNAYR